MSVRAYVVNSIDIEYEDDLMIEKNEMFREPLFNLWKDEDVLDWFDRVAQLYLCDDQIGEIYLNDEVYEDWKFESGAEEYEEASEKLKEVLRFVDNWVEERGELNIRCF